MQKKKTICENYMRELYIYIFNSRIYFLSHIAKTLNSFTSLDTVVKHFNHKFEKAWKKKITFITCNSEIKWFQKKKKIRDKLTHFIAT